MCDDSFVEIDVLLTGAGFTCNFGSPLADGMFELIYNSHYLNNFSKVKQKLLKDKMSYPSKLTYEDTYEYIVLSANSSFLVEEKNALIKALNTAYSFMDNQLRNISNIDQKPIFHFLNKWLHYNKHKKVFFTLNQDLFIERHFYQFFENKHHLKSLLLSNFSLDKNEDDILLLNRLCAQAKISRHFNEYEEKWALTDIIDKIEQDVIAEYESQNTFCPYIKLHGSQDFFDKNKQPLILTGKNKNKQINDIGLLNAYHKIFAECLTGANIKKCNLTLIGYSFNDSHINEYIKYALLKEKLSVTLITKDSLNNIVKII